MLSNDCYQKPNPRPRIQCGFSLGTLSPRVVNVKEFIPYPHYIFYDFKAVLPKKDLSVTSDLMINSSHIPISVAINGSLN